MKFDGKKELKQLFGTKQKPVSFKLETMNYLTIQGEGNPNKEGFQKHIQTLYSVMYALKFAYKKNPTDSTWTDFVVPPLMGWWTLNEEAQQNKSFTKDDFVYELRILLPSFISNELVLESIKIAKDKKGFPEIDELVVKEYGEMNVGQILHIGSYDDEPETFSKLEDYLEKQGLQRVSKNHVEIYLSDARKTAPEKLKTILQVEI